MRVEEGAARDEALLGSEGLGSFGKILFSYQGNTLAHWMNAAYGWATTLDTSKFVAVNMHPYDIKDGTTLPEAFQTYMMTAAGEFPH